MTRPDKHAARFGARYRPSRIRWLSQRRIARIYDVPLKFLSRPGSNRHRFRG